MTMPNTNNHPVIIDPHTGLSGCTCGQPHPVPTATLYLGADAARVLADDCRAAFADQPVLLLSDPDVQHVVGHALEAQLRAAGVNLTSFILDADPVADDQTVAKVRKLSADKSLVISVGSGTLNDLGKYSASEDGKPFWVMPTAPSMNGYTSGIAAIKVKGVKRTLPATPPARLYVLPEVIQNAPLKLRQAGFCDVLAKVVSDIDWQAESLLFSQSYCGLPAAMMAGVEKDYSEQPEAIGRGEEKAVMGLFHGLLISGVAMSLAGSSAPASGGEHLMSHFWDMREPLTGRVPERHGLQVGLGIILSAACYQLLAGLDKTALAPRAEAEFSATAARIPAIWGPYAAEVAGQFANKRDALAAFDELLPRFWEKLRPLFSQVRPPEYFVELFSRVGAPFGLEAFRLSVDEFLLAAMNSRAIRERITVLDFAAHAGILEQAAARALALIRT